LREAQPHLTGRRQQPLHLQAQTAVLFHQQLLTLKHRLQPLGELSLKDAGQIGQQGFQFRQLGGTLLALQLETSFCGLLLQLLKPVGQGFPFH
jgi:hypothetical protein